MTRWRHVGILAGVILLGGPGGEGARLLAQGMRQPPASTVVPPVDLRDQTVVDEGARLFSQYCTGYCHGKGGRRSRAPRLRGQTFESGYLYARISRGFPPMPAFQTLLSSEDIWKLVAYILSLADATED